MNEKLYRQCVHALLTVENEEDYLSTIKVMNEVVKRYGKFPMKQLVSICKAEGVAMAKAGRA